MKFQDLKYLITQSFKEWSEDKASRLAASLAYYTVFSIPPLRSRITHYHFVVGLLFCPNPLFRGRIYTSICQSLQLTSGA